MKYIQIFIIFIIVSYGGQDIFNQPYTKSNLKHLSEKFDLFSNTESMECNSITNPAICSFNTKSNAHLGAIIAILLVTFLLMNALLGRASGYSYMADTQTMQEQIDAVDSSPINWKSAIVVLVLALYTIKYIRSDDTNKIFNFNNQTLIIQNRDKEELSSYPFAKIKAIEVLKYTEDKYIHYELNLQLEDKRLNLYAGKDDLLCTLTASSLSDKIQIPVIKIDTNK